MNEETQTKKNGRSDEGAAVLFRTEIVS